MEKEIVNDEAMKMEAKEKKKRLDKLQQQLKISKDIRYWTASYGFQEESSEHNKSIKKRANAEKNRQNI